MYNDDNNKKKKKKKKKKEGKPTKQKNTPSYQMPL